ncbi:MAG: SDR family oxidoreductase [Planctomycetota bacterium]
MSNDCAVALVTGAARRVGRAIAIELARAGFDVAVHYRSSKTEAADVAAAVTALGRRAELISADLADPASWSSVIDQVVGALGRLDILVNNASVFPADDVSTATVRDRPTPEPLTQWSAGIPLQEGECTFPLDHWESTLRTNLIAPAALAHYAKPYLSASGRGKIVNLSDISAERPWGNHLAYCVSKAGLSSLTKGLARALAPHVQVNAVAPGIVVFPQDYSPELRQKLIDKTLVGREGTPEEVAALVRFLVEHGHYVTGQVIPIDGGRSIA